jgi:hypothetical protein
LIRFILNHRKLYIESRALKNFAKHAEKEMHLFIYKVEERRVKVRELMYLLR